MSHTQLDLLLPDQAAILIRKKRFWRRAMWISVAITPLFLATFAVCYSMAMDRLFQTIATIDNQNIADGFEHSLSEISWLAAMARTSFAIAAFGFLLFLISLIRCLSLPKITKPTQTR